MSKMTIFQFGVIVFACYLSSQVLSQSTTAQGTTGTSANVISTKADAKTTMATDTYSSSTNSTKGGSAMLQADRLSFLIPVVMSASFLRCSC